MLELQVDGQSLGNIQNVANTVTGSLLEVPLGQELCFSPPSHRIRKMMLLGLCFSRVTYGLHVAFTFAPAGFKCKHRMCRWLGEDPSQHEKPLGGGGTGCLKAF